MKGRAGVRVASLWVGLRVKRALELISIRNQLRPAECISALQSAEFAPFRTCCIRSGAASSKYSKTAQIPTLAGLNDSWLTEASLMLGQ
jgi:hypothetical protein